MKPNENQEQTVSVAVADVGSTAWSGSVHFSSASDEWPTPRAYFEKVEREFGPFDLDPCATAESAKAPKYYTKADDGLAQEWRGRVWMNPPYGRTIGAWMRKAYEAAQAGCVVVCLVPARTDTAWWHDYAAKGTVRFVRGRLKFGGAKHSAPFPSALVVFGLPNQNIEQLVKCNNGNPTK